MSQRPTRRSYLMAMAAGAVIIGGSTFGVTLAHSMRAGADPLAATAATAPAATGSMARPSESTTTSSLGSAAPSSSAGSSTPAALSSSSTSTSTSTSTAPPTLTAASSGRQGTTSGAPTIADTATSNLTSTEAPKATPTPTPAPKPTPAPAPAPAAAQFKDGQYSATASYDSPGGPQKIGVTLTLQTDTVTAAALDLLGDQGITHTYQGIFQQGYSAEVVGKKIDSIKLGAVGGSSLTSGGFNEALAQIEQQARG